MSLRAINFETINFEKQSGRHLHMNTLTLKQHYRNKKKNIFLVSLSSRKPGILPLYGSISFRILKGKKKGNLAIFSDI